jgi:sulfur-oxidizing protein SoxY
MKRRGFLVAGALAATQLARAQTAPALHDVRALVGEITGGAQPLPGGVEVEMPQIAENGHSVPLRIRVRHPMTPASHVRAVHVFAERNPRPRIATFHFSLASGRAEVSTRVRLAGTQKVTVLAELSDRTFRITEVSVLVTTGACLDDSL